MISQAVRPRKFGEGVNALSISAATAFLLIMQAAWPAFASAANARRSDEPGQGGFVKEIDEAGARGQVSRVSPLDIEIFGRFAVSASESLLIFSGRPVKSPPGTPYELYRINTFDNGAPVRLTSGSSSHCLYPSFTADGSGIVFYSSGVPWMMNANGGGARRKLPSSETSIDCCASVSRDNVMAFNSVDYGMYGANGLGAARYQSVKMLIWTSEMSGSGLTQYREGSFPQWSARGDKIVFDYEGDVWMMDRDGTNLIQVTQTQKTYEGLPSFDASGNYVVFASDEGSKNKMYPDFNIWAVRADGTGKQQITSLGSWDSWPLATKRGVYFLSGRGAGKDRVTRVWRISWSPDALPLSER